MQRFLKIFVLLVAALAAIPSYAQLGLRLTMNRNVYMRFEPVYACVTIKNDSGRALVFGSDPRLQGFIYFEIRDRNGNLVTKYPGRDISSTGLVLQAGEVRSIILPVNEYYDLTRPGDYSIHVRIAHNMLAHEFRSAGECIFQVTEGAVVWKNTVGVPELDEQGEVDANTTKPAKERTYFVKELDDPPNRYYYLVVEDQNKIYGVTRIGNVFGVEKFQAEVDMLGRIHLLMPVAPRIFHYLSFSIDGMNTINTYWRTTDTIPTLIRDRTSGIVKRIGGIQAKAGVDFALESRDGLSGDKIKELEDQKAPVAEGILDLNREVGDFDRSIKDRD